MVENEQSSLLAVFLVFALGFVVLTLPVGLVLGYLARRMAVQR
jgi:glutamate transport system permease protein